MNFETLPPEKWQTADVTDWLDSFGFGEYADNFAAEKITGDFLLKYVNDVEIMKELGITKKVQRKRLEFEIEKLIEKQQQQSHNGSSSKRLQKENTSSSMRAKRKRKSYESEDEVNEILSEIDENASSNNKKNAKAKLKEKVTTPKRKTAKTTVTEEKTLSEDYIDLPEIIFETALSNRSKCKACNEKIEKDRIKFGVLSFFNRNGTLFPYHSWFHPHCGIAITAATAAIPPREPHSSSKSNNEEEKEMQAVEVIKCKYCSQFFSEIELQSHEHSYWLKIGVKRKILLCQYCAEMILSKGEGRLTIAEVQQLPGFTEQSEEVQKQVTRFLTTS